MRELRTKDRPQSEEEDRIGCADVNIGGRQLGDPMKATRSTAGIVAGLLTIVAAISFLYGVPAGRQVRRETLRTFRLMRNATGIDPVPILTVRMWNPVRQQTLLIEVYESGRVVALRHGERIERQLTPGAIAKVIESGKAALDDFSADGCGTTTRGQGFSSELYLLIEGARVGSICRDAADWPNGFETRRMFSEIESHLPGIFLQFWTSPAGVVR